MADYDNTNKGILFINDRKTTDKHPDYKGSINVGGKEFWLSAWMKQTAKGDAISLSIEAKDAQQSAPKPTPAAKPAPTAKPKQVPGFSEMDDQIPF